MLAAVGAVLGWGLKAVAIGVAGGLDRSPFEGPLYFLGLIAIVIAFAALGVAVAGRRPVPIKVLGAVAGVFAGVGLSLATDALAGAVVPESAGWVAEEAGLWLGALVALAVTAYWHSRQAAGGTGT